jgi:putative ABC transport system permease protein
MNASDETLVRVRGAEKLFRKGAEEVRVLRGLDLDIPRGDFLALMGPSGSGKSTLLNLLAGLDRPTSGSVEIGGQRIDQLGERALARWRARHVGLVFQFYNLLPVLSAAKNVELPLLLAPLSAKQRRQQVATALALVGLEHRAGHMPRTLSGGEQQRVGIARAIVTDPTLILADEPTGDLDRKTGDGILDLLGALNREHGKTIVMVTHDPHAAAGDGGMTRLGLLAAGFKRHRLRLFLTGSSIVVAFILFSYLVAVRKAFEMGVDVAGRDRLVVRHKTAIIQMLPADYEADMEKLAGVVDATPLSWFGGIYQDPRNFFGQFPVKPEEYLAMYPEFLLPAEQKATWLRTRTGAVAGRATAEKYGWKVGDRIPIQATVWMPKTGGNTWEFELVGIYDGKEKETDTTQFLFRNDYFQENRTFGEGSIGWFMLRIADPDRAPQMVEAVDALFANSPAETKTETEGAFAQSFANQMGNIGAIVTAILAAVFLTLLLMAGNTMAQAVRERTQELGVLKALGFGNGEVMALVLGESVLMTAVAGGLGLALGYAMVSQGDPTGGFLPIFFFPPEDLLLGAGLVLLLGLAAGLLPALGAMRLRTVDALRRGG